MKILINTDFGKYHAGERVSVGDKNGIALDPYWRKKIKDAELDHCLTIVAPKRPPKKTESNKTESKKDD